MKNQRIKTILSLLIAFVLSLGITIPVFAANSSIRFIDGKIFASDTGTTSLEGPVFENFENLLPGDIKTEEITIYNESSDFDYIKVYVRAKPLDPIKNSLTEQALAAGESIVSMKDFLNHLSIKVYNGSQLIYDQSSKEIFGLVENFYLGTLDKDESLTLTVQVELPIELGNEYSNRVGDLEWIITVEGFDVEETKVTETIKTDPGPTTTATKIPLTGEQSTIQIVIILLIIATAGMLTIVFLKRKEKNQDKL